MKKTHVLMICLVGILTPFVSYADVIHITSPVANEVLTPNQTKRITWTGGADKVSIYRIHCIALLGSTNKLCSQSSDSTNMNDPLIAGVNNVGYYDWTVRQGITGWSGDIDTYQIQIRDTDATTTADTDTSPSFYISSPPQLTMMTNPGSFTDNISYLLAPNIPNGDYPVEIYWTLSAVDSCIGSGDWSGPQLHNTGDNNHITLGKVSDFTTNKTYTLTCSNPAGSVTKSVTFKVASPFPVVPPQPSPVAINTDVKVGEVKSSTLSSSVNVSTQVPVTMTTQRLPMQSTQPSMSPTPPVIAPVRTTAPITTVTTAVHNSSHIPKIVTHVSTTTVTSNITHGSVDVLIASTSTSSIFKTAATSTVHVMLTPLSQDESDTIFNKIWKRFISIF